MERWFSPRKKSEHESESDAVVRGLENIDMDNQDAGKHRREGLALLEIILFLLIAKLSQAKAPALLAG